MNPKIKKRRELSSIVKQMKQEGKKIVTTNGTFDILHYGHIRLLEYSKKQGDILIIGMNSDSSVRKNKGKGRPIVRQKDRAEVLAALQYIDYVTIFNEADCRKFVKSIKPNIHVNASDYGYRCIERETVEEHGGRLNLFYKLNGYSTTGLIEKIIKTQK